MKNIKYLVLILILIFGIFLVSCDDKVDDIDPNIYSNIHLNGDEEITIEVKTEYEELGIDLPDEYTYEVFEDVDMNILGKQEISYLIYDEDGKMIKELKRTINVVDTTAPTIMEAKDKTFYLGVGYTINDFLYNYNDNYDNRRDLKVSQTEFMFNELGEQTVEIKITDSSNNTVTFSKAIDVKFDIVSKLKYEYRTTPSIYETQVFTNADTGERTELIRVLLHVYSEYVEGLSYTHSVRYYKRNNSLLGDYAKVEVIYDIYTKDVLPFHYEIWKDGKVVARIVFGGAKYDNDIQVSFPGILMNETEYTVEEMAEEARLYLADVINSFRDYVRDVLHFEVNDFNKLIWYY